MFSRYLHQAFLLVLIFSVVPLAAASTIGLVLSFVQSATQLQEQALVFLARFCVLSVVLAVGYAYASQEMVAFVQSVFKSLEELGRM